MPLLWALMVIGALHMTYKAWFKPSELQLDEMIKYKGTLLENWVSSKGYVWVCRFAYLFIVVIGTLLIAVTVFR